jgi:hypothetical protein
VNPRPGLDDVEKNSNSDPLVVQPIAQSLYQLTYPGFIVYKPEY